MFATYLFGVTFRRNYVKTLNDGIACWKRAFTPRIL